MVKYIYILFNDFFSSLNCIASNERMIVNWNGCGRKQSWPKLKYCSGIFLETLRKTMKNLIVNSSMSLALSWFF